MPRLTTLFLLLISYLSLSTASLQAQSTEPVYDYPFSDPHTATVVGTPKHWQTMFAHPAPLNTEQLARLSPLPLPEVFWYQDGLYYSSAWQDQEAPLVFVIAGTGSGHDSGTMKVLANSWYNAGFHVVLLSSPTYANFIATASTNGVAGRLHADASDLYQVMSRIIAQHPSRQISHFNLAGYSLGGAHAAYVGQLDTQQQQFDFQRILLINPPVSLYNSVVRLDAMLQENLDLADPAAVDRFLTQAFDKIAQVYVEDDALAANDDILYTLYRKLGPDETALSTLIGTAFRFSSSNMLFTSDVMTNQGYLKPAALQLPDTASLTPYLKAALKVSFVEYFDQFFLPFFRQHDGTISRSMMIKALSLYPLQAYLHHDHRVHMVTNADDLILDKAELNWLQDTFGERARVFPTGGHLGNIAHPAVTYYLQQVMQPTSAQEHPHDAP